MKQPDEQQLQKYLRRKKIALIADIILIIVLLCIGIYVWKNVEYVKIADDPCGICEEKTGGECVSTEDVVTELREKLREKYKFNKTAWDKLQSTNIKEEELK